MTTHEAINSFLGSATPTFCYEIYRVDGKIYGYKIDWKHWSVAVKNYDCSHDLQGRHARYILVSDDRSFTRQEAISFAKAIHEGVYSQLHIGLGDVNPDRK